ncbi:MAG: hypothetical protein D6689_06485 [Deltaproteobacteria bacterium]|nr:MAG: hypothetical protein D6689_06485 [Deltaproteobacteria bacterium]
MTYANLSQLPLTSGGPMHRIFTPLPLVALSALAAAPARADDAPAPQVAVSGEVRIREEVLRNLYSPADPSGENNLEYAHMRSRARIDADVHPNLAVVIELQDVRILGEEGSTVADTEGVDLKRGTIVVRNPGGHPLTLELGRFVLAYGDQRIIGHLEWFDQGRTYDGARLSLKPAGYFADVFGVRVRETLADEQDHHVAGVYAGATDWIPDGAVEAYAIYWDDSLEAMGEMDTGTTGFTTAGARAAVRRADLVASVEAAVQLGRLRGDDLMAFGAVAAADYTFASLPAKLTVGGGVAYGSGDSDPTDGDAGTFQTLLPTNHLHYGYADLASWSNHLSVRASVGAAPVDGLKLKLDYHHLRLADPAGGWFNAGGALVRAGNADASSHLGDEIDVTAVWTPMPHLALLFGLSEFVPGGFVDDTGGGNAETYGYAQARATF